MTERPSTESALDGEALALVLDIAMSPPPTFWHDRGETCLACSKFVMGGFRNRPETAHPSECWWRRAVEIERELRAHIDGSGDGLGVSSD